MDTSADNNQFVIQPSSNWTTADYLSIYSDMVNSGADRNAAGNTVLGAMVGQGYNPQLSASDLYNVAPFNSAIDSGLNSVGPNPNSKTTTFLGQSFYDPSSNPFLSGGTTRTTGNEGKICLVGVCFNNPFYNPTNGTAQSVSSQCDKLDIFCHLKQSGANIIALVAGFVLIIFGLVMLKHGDAVSNAANKLGDHLNTIVASKAASAAAV